MPSYEERVHKGLTDAFQKVRRVPLDLATARHVVLSDMHRGQGDGADDFRHAQDTYRKALTHYHDAGFTLHLLGDVEELWEARAKKIVAKYDDILRLEQRFIADGRLRRYYGNHDIDWSDPQHKSYAHLAPYLRDGGSAISIDEGVVAEIMLDGTKLGDLFVVHGHQGTLDSDRYAALSRFFVRYVWRNIQRLLGISITTPSNDFELRKKHETAMYEWAITHPQLVMIAGHTHRPVFMSLSEECFVLRQAEDLEAAAFETPAAYDAERATLEARRRELVEELDGHPFDVDRGARPAYFNTGCCSYADGSITGLEIKDRSITLVRWRQDRKRVALRKAADLTDVFSRCGC